MWIGAWIFVIGAGLGGVALILWARARMASARPLPEAIPECTVADLEAGRFLVVGRVVPIATIPSAVDGAPCVYAERAEYRTLSSLVPLMREVEHGAVSHPFYLDDGTGRVRVDPAETLIECATAVADAGLTAERRLRAGEEVSLAATFRRASKDSDLGEGPYRGTAAQWEAVADAAGPPRLSHRTVEEMVVVPVDDVTAFLSGIGAMMLLMGTLLGFVMGFVL